MKSKPLNAGVFGKRILEMLTLFVFCFGAFAQSESMKITGKVIDEFNEPMMGVTIMIPGTTTGTITDLDGNFSLDVPQGSKDLTISFVGYESACVVIPSNGFMHVNLVPFTHNLNYLVVAASGTAI